MNNILLKTTVLTLATIGLITACGSGDDASGSLTILLESEDVIVDGLEAGDETENIRDGWGVTFDKYLVVVGDIDLHFSTDDELEAEAGDLFAVDLTQVPSSGLELWGFDELKSGRWEIAYSTWGGAHDVMRDESVKNDDFASMVDNDWTYLVQGLLTSDEGESCPPASLVVAGDREPNGNKSGDNPCYDAKEVEFEFGATVETVYGPCELDGVPGISVPTGGTQSAAVTIHGDHIFFNGFPEGSEGGVRREAQWLADCDLDLDGKVTQEELQAISPAQLPAMEDYQFGGAPIEPTDIYEYVRAQLKTQGHYQGEGECETDGEAHEHGHDDHDDHDDHDEDDHDE